MITGKWIDGYQKSSLKDADMIKQKVFVEEQGVAEEIVFDERDELSIHLVVYDNDEPVACGRMTKIGTQLVFGRIATLKEHRGKGYGDFVMRLLIRKAFDMGEEKQYLHSQLSAKGFYEKLGFKAYGDVYEEAGIPHISMVHEGDVGGCKK